VKKRLPKVYYMAPNGIKIELKGFGPASFYAKEQIRTEFARAFQVPKDMLFPDKKLVGVTVHEPRMNVALTDELKAKGSVEITFKYSEVSDV
jgi:alpha-D-ribose 1-methylphosphonate 5-triphosphate synthase subunit PhnL